MRTLAFDIETIGNVKIIPLLPEIVAAKNLKDPVKIQDDIEKKKQEQFEKMGLDKTQALICCVSIMDIDTDEIESVILNPETLDEKELIEEVWEILHTGERYLSFNGLAFDIPMLTFRSMINRVQPSVKISTQKYRITNHIDIRAILGDWDTYAKGSLDYYSKIILGESKADDVDGSFVQSLWDCGAYQEIVEYNQAEIRSMKAIYRRLEGYYF